MTYDLGFYDQTHFIKEFKKFSGESPMAYFSDYSTTENSLERNLISTTL